MLTPLQRLLIVLAYVASMVVTVLVFYVFGIPPFERMPAILLPTPTPDGACWSSCWLTPPRLNLGQEALDLFVRDQPHPPRLVRWQPPRLAPAGKHSLLE